MEAKVSADTALAKARLLAGGAVRIPKDFRLPFPPSKSTAGPGAGFPEVVFSFGGTRAKKTISRVEGEFDLVVSEEGLRLMRNAETVADAVELLPTLYHAPFQAFMNVDRSCMFNCAFCNAHRLEHDPTKNLTDDAIVDMVVSAAASEEFAGVALTSGVPVSVDESVENIVTLVRRIRDELPDTAIGVEPYVTHPRHIDELREAGATEIKLNIESFNPEIFDKVCPNRDYGAILHAVNHACEVFDRNSVCSNIIFGLGETDDDVLQGVRVLANMGAVATLRALRTNERNHQNLATVLGEIPPITASRMLDLARGQKAILDQYGLTPLRFRTMCHACLSCDIVPFWDV